MAFAVAVASLCVSLWAVRPVAAAETVPGVALKRTGTADCSQVMQAGAVLLLGVKVTGRHTICVTDYGGQRWFYFDGRDGGSESDSALFGLGTIGHVGDRDVKFGELPSAGDTFRLMFCQGQTLVLQPLEKGRPKFVGAYVDTLKYGKAIPEVADVSGRPLHKTAGVRKMACRGGPPTTRVNWLFAFQRGRMVAGRSQLGLPA